MLEISNTAAQTIAVGETVLFDTVKFNSKCNNSEFFRLGTGAVQVAGGCHCDAIYEVSFGANVSGATAGTPVELTINYAGSALPETEMISTPSAADALNHVYTSTVVRIPYQIGGNAFSVTNTGTTDITIGANPVFTVVRRG